jgi:Predicted oxidoreductases (related to aryl-alcohol dehydrogenases)
LSNLATVEATRAQALSHPELAYSPLGSTGLNVSQAGFGGYRILPGADEHQQALSRALGQGINLLDTSSNYTDGGSETLMGRVLAGLFDEGKLARDQVVVVSKAGYIQGSNHQLSQERKQRGEPFPELVEYAAGLEHCIHPEFLADQLERSLERLGLAALDVFMLHNPGILPVLGP